MKKDNPQVRFKLESKHVTRESITTSSVGESGLEAPEEFWVELQYYKEMFGEPEAHELVFEDCDGVRKAGVPLIKLD